MDDYSKLVPSHLTKYIVPQRHIEYTESEHFVWKNVFGTTLSFCEQYRSFVHPSYLEGLYQLNLDFETIPDLKTINDKLRTVGWSAVCVDGYIPVQDYAAFPASRLIPIIRTIRGESTSDFSPVADLIHDILGHVPMLLDSEYREYFQALADVRNSLPLTSLDMAVITCKDELECSNGRPNKDRDQIVALESKLAAAMRELQKNPSPLVQVGRMHHWSVECGLTGTRETFQIFGAILLSSHAERSHICQKKARIFDYSADVIHVDSPTQVLQNQVFVAPELASFREVLGGYLREIGSSQ